MPLLSDSPFAVLSAVAAPAVLTNACSVLSLGTGNRIARVVDRSRVVMAAQKSVAAENAAYKIFARQLGQLGVRSRLLMNALRLFYASLGLFAASALTAIIGAVLTAYDLPLAFHLTAIAGFTVGALGVLGLVSGCALMVHETRIAIQTLEEEHEFAALSQTILP